ncbi:Transposon Ty3-I Gag-Pol polyprotein [Labeo rohita]|uniref:ribonuclease H n=1 Tax=Labeo rohita TaxID=84645 RepID=A0ABQ8M006_LABRO|nr:Transposon Ty3-I Gag-Pol polyprotein [Labeo rohita]
MESERRCVPPCIRLISEDDPHGFCFECLGEEHAALGLEGECEHCDQLPIKVLRARLAFFKEERAAAPSLQSWGSRVDLAEARETGTPLSLAISPDQEVLASVSEARPGASSERAEDTSSLASAEIDLESATSERSSRDDKAYEELLGVVTRAVDRLKLDWPQEQETLKRSKLDDRFLSGGRGEGPQRRSLPFFGDLHDELARSWSKPYSSRVFVPSTSIYSTIVDSQARGYMMMPQVEETLAGYLSPGSSSSLKKPMLPTKPCRLTSSLVGKAYQAAGQAGASLHTMAVLQAYQADLLKDLSTGGTIDEEAFLELRRATDLSLRATKQTARAIGRSMAAMVSTERHLWLNLTGIKERDRSFLLDAPVSPSGLFGDAVNSVVTRFREARRHEEAFVRFLPRRAQASGPSATQSRPGLVSLRRDVQKESVASRAPPRKDWGAARRTPQSASKRPDLRSILTKKKVLRVETTVLPPPPLVFRGAAVSDEVLHGRLPPAMFQDTISEVSKLVPLSEKLAAWKLLPDISPWVVRTVEKGYRIQFAYRPPRFNGVVSTSVKPERVHLLTQELQTLLDKGAIEHVPLPDRDSGYYSRYFLVPKKDGGLRPILDLRGLNRYLRTYKFKMLTIKMIVSQIQSRDWFVTIDLKDAYFHVEILPQHRRFLRFAFGGEAYQYRVLPFGLALSPRTYTKCMDAALAPLRLQGIRILNYIDDWLILARSQELALRHRDVVLAHLRSLGLRLNAKKSVLSPAQRTTYLGVVWDSITMQAQLSPARVESILNTLKNIKLGHKVTLHYFQRVLGLMAAASTVIPLGLLHMRPFQLWLRARDFHPRANPQRQIRVTRQGLRTLSMWFRPRFLTLGPTLGPCCRRKMLTTDASLKGWGAVLNGRPAQGIWRGHHLNWHINCLEMMAVFQALKYFLQQLRGFHVLVRVDSTAVVSYINRQGGLRSRRLNRLAQQILLWAQDKFLSLRAIYIPGHMNMGADFLSRQAVTHGEWKLHPEVVSQIWERFYEAEVDLFASQETAQCPLYFSLTPPAPLGLDAMAHMWPRLRLAPLADQSMVLRSNIPPRRLAVGDSGQERSPISGAGDNISSPARALEPSCLAPEGDQLRDAGLPADVVETILSARAPSTRRSYALKWRVFESWCVTHHADPVHCQVVSVLEFLQEKLSSGISPGTLRVYVAAISACHTLIDGVSVGKHPLVARFIRGARRLRPPTRATVPSWDLAIVLEGLSGTPFEPLESAHVRFLTLKMFFLMAITSLKRIGDLQALATSPSCLDFAPGLLSPLRRSLHRSRKGYTYCVQYVLFKFMSTAQASGVSQSNFSYAMGAATGGAAATKRIMSHWVRDAIALAYEARGQASPLELRAHSTRGVASSTAIARGAPPATSV